VAGGAFVKITGGPHDVGFKSVSINDERELGVDEGWNNLDLIPSASDFSVSVSRAERAEKRAKELSRQGARLGLRLRRGGKDSDAPVVTDYANKKRQPSLSIYRTSPHSLKLQVGIYSFAIDNVDQYVDITELDVTCWECLVNQAKPEGLLGQTWNATAVMKSSEEDVVEFRVKEGDLLGCQHQHDRFCASNNGKSKRIAA